MSNRTAVLGSEFSSVLKKIENLDLEPIMVKLMDLEEGEGWSLEHVRVVEEWYRRFLFLNAVYPDRSIVPTKAIDTFWHYHILDTEKYAEDCQNVFGYFLHHFPYFGIRGVEDRQNLLNASKQTWGLFRLHFNEEPATLLGDAGKCVSSCSGKSCSHCQSPTCQGGPKVGQGQERPRLAALLTV